jgi:hypothetical protein
MPYITQVAVGRRTHLNVFGNDYDTTDGTGETIIIFESLKNYFSNGTRVKISHLVASLPTSCVRTACPKLSTSLEQLVNNL